MRKIKQIDKSQIERFNPTIHDGLNEEQILQRQEQGLTNKSKKKYSKSYLQIFAGNIFTIFNLLGFIVFIALINVGTSLPNFFFVIFYIANALIGIIQEIRAKRCTDKLAILSSNTTTVIRNGQSLTIPSTNIVLDEIFVLELGNQIPTDCIIIEGELEVNESLLTGESIPVKKRCGEHLLAGSFVISGKCYCKAEYVGEDNYVEKLSAKAKQYKKPKSEIMNSISKLIKFISFAIIPIAIAFMVKSALYDGNIKHAIEGTSTVVIGMIPAGMFLLTSVALAIGIIKLAKHNTLVQDLYSLEMLARVDTICFDKTGTITDGNMSVSKYVELHAYENVNEIVSSMLGTLQDNNLTAKALDNYFGNKVEYKAINKIPFNSTKKLCAVEFENLGTFSFGAPEFVLPKEEYLKIKEQINAYASQGFRVLLLAKSPNSIIEEQLPTDFIPLGLILIVDSIRSDAVETIKWFKDNGVSVKVISGDNPVTVAEVSKRVGVVGAEKFISLEGLSDKEVFDCANKYTVFGRVTPEQKAILIKALKSDGHVTAMTGDGINDILALKESDCAITVAEGSDAARNVSHLILMNNNFNSMPKVVYEGRRVINNVESSASLFLMKTFFTMLMAIIILFLPNVHAYPFQLSQMIMLEVFIIGLPAFFLSMQPNDSLIQGKFITYVLKKSIPAAIVMTISVLIIEIVKITVGTFPQNDYEIYKTMQVFALTLAGLINLLITCRPFNRYRTILFASSTLIVLSVIILSMFGIVPILNGIFACMIPFKMYWHHILLLIGIVIIDVPLLIMLQYIESKIKFLNR